MVQGCIHKRFWVFGVEDFFFLGSRKPIVICSREERGSYSYYFLFLIIAIVIITICIIILFVITTIILSSSPSTESFPLSLPLPSPSIKRKYCFLKRERKRKGKKMNINKHAAPRTKASELAPLYLLKRRRTDSARPGRGRRAAVSRFIFGTIFHGAKKNSWGTT